MALNKFGMGIVIGARDLASKVFNRVGGSFQRMTRKVERGARRQEIAMRSVAIGGALLLASTQALGGVVALSDAAGKFEQDITGVGAAVQATTQEMELLRDAAIDAGISEEFQRMTRKVERGARRQEIAMRSVAIGGALLLASTQALGGVVALSDAAGKFEQDITGVGAAVQATTQEMELLRDAAIDAGIKTQFDPREATDGLRSLATAGQTATEATKTLIPVLDLAAGSLGQLGVGEAASAVVGTLKSYSMGVEKASAVTDKLLRITQLSNFQARDFEVGLAKAASQAGVFNQSLDDTLITMGLLRNANIDASSASTAFREAVRRVGSDSRAQQTIEAKGVDIFDKKTKKMRSLVDIMLDLDKKTKKLTDREKNRIVVQAFGARGLLAFNSVQKATFTTMRDGEQVVLKGTEAIEAMRTEMGKSTGTAAKFREALLDTFEGQKTLLRGTLETFKIVLGEPLAKVLKPIIGGIVNVLNSLLRWFEDLPEPVKKGILGIVSFTSALTGIIGGAILLKGVLGLLGFSIGGLIVTLGQLLIIGPAVLLFVGGLGIASYAAFRAFQKNTGGITDSWQEMVRKITLAYKALKQMIFDVGFSDEIRKELDKAENQGVMRFLKGVERFGRRMVAFWGGLKKGFEEGVDALAESSAMRKLVDTMNSVFALFTGEKQKDSQEALKEWGDRGAETGKKLAELGEKALNVINKLLELGKRFAKFAGTLSAADVEQGIDKAREAFDGMWTTLKRIGTGIKIGVDVISATLNVLSTAFAFLFETVASYWSLLGALFDAGKSILKGDFRGAGDAIAKWRATPVYEETRKQAGDTIRVFDPESRIGLEAEDREKAEKSALQRAMAARRETARTIVQRQKAGEDTTQIVEKLEELNKSIWEISKRPPPDLNVIIEAEQVASKVREANKRNKGREVEPEPPPEALFLPG